MKPFFQSLCLLSALGIFFFITTISVHADPQADLSTFSSFKDLDLAKLSQGDILAARGALMNFPRGLFVETCFLVHAPPDKTLRNLLDWDPSKHESIGLYGHYNLSTPIVPQDFTQLASLPQNKGTKALMYSTLHMNPNQPDIQISREAAKMFKASQPTAGQKEKDVFTAIWANYLTTLANNFLAGGPDQYPLYESGGTTIKASDELHSILTETGAVLSHFEPLLSTTGIADLIGQTPRAKNTPTLYWEVQDVEGMAAVDLGAIYSMPLDTGWQMMDCEYYVSGGYLNSVILYQGWPITVGSEQMTLVWRGDFVSAPAIAYTHGVERVATGMIMLQEIKKTDAFFQKDVLKMP